MKKNFFLLFTMASLLTVSCNNATESEATPAADKSSEMPAPETAQFTPEMVVNKKDFTCGMPTSAGISDTCHYEGKAYGFCSAECKAEFQKNPAAAIAAAQ